MVVEERNGVALAVTEHREQKREADARFCHLHLHTDYSALDGGCTVDQVTARAAELGMPAVAITDHGVLSGVCLLYTSDAADDLLCVDLGGRRIIKKKKKKKEFKKLNYYE